MSELCPNVEVMIRHRAATVETLAEALGQELLRPAADPFCEDLVLTRSGAISRWLAQRLSTRLGSTGHEDGISARIRFLTMDQFAALIRSGPDPWSADSLVPQVLWCVDDMMDSEVFSPVRAYLGEPATRPHRRLSFAHSMASRFSAYSTWDMDMLTRWARSDFVDPAGSPLPSEQVWQAHVWNRMCDHMGATPWQDADLVCAEAPSIASHFERIVVFCPDLLRPIDERILASLDHLVTVFDQTHQRCGKAGFDRVSAVLSKQLTYTTSVLDRLVTSDQILHDPDRPATLLGSIQDRLATGTSALAELDDSVQIHASYGDQQVDVLADQLVRLLGEDPNLEPRDILVLVDRMEDHRRQLEAFLRPDDSPDSDPRHRIRASMSGQDHDDMADLLAFLADLVGSRATSDDLLRLTSFPAVMSHFGFSTPDLDKISTLISSSGIRWGLNSALRASHEMGAFAQNTWMAGLGRMVLGVGLREDDLVYQGTVFPLDAVESDTVRLVEALGQIISHVRSCCETWTVPAEPQEWGQRFRGSMDFLTGTDWQTSPTSTIITDLGSISSPALTLAEAQSLFAQLSQDYRWRSSFLNGDLGVVELGTMSLVPHKVIVVFGLDANWFPRQPDVDGDNVQSATMEDPRITDHQVFYDAIMAAREKFIAVYAGFDPATAAPTPMPTPLMDLLSLSDLCSRGSGTEALVHVHTHIVQATPVHHTVGAEPLRAPVTEPVEVEIDDLCDVMANPAAYWLRRNAGLLSSVLKQTDPVPTTIPVTLSPLERWQIVTRMIRLLLAEKSPEAILAAELRRGTVPPGQTGVGVAQDCLGQATSIVAHAQPILDQPLSWRTISQSSDVAPDLVGQIPVHGTTILETLAGRVQPRQEIPAWIKILALQVAYPDQMWRASLVGARGTVTLTAPNPVEARRHLDYVRRIHLHGLVSALPLPPAPSAHAAKYMVRNLPVNMVDIERRLSNTWSREPAWSLLWPSFTEMIAEPAPEDETAPGAGFPSRFMTLAHGIYVPLMRAGGVS